MTVGLSNFSTSPLVNNLPVCNALIIFSIISSWAEPYTSKLRAFLKSSPFNIEVCSRYREYQPQISSVVAVSIFAISGASCPERKLRLSRIPVCGIERCRNQHLYLLFPDVLLRALIRNDLHKSYACVRVELEAVSP